MQLSLHIWKLKLNFFHNDKVFSKQTDITLSPSSFEFGIFPKVCKSEMPCEKATSLTHADVLFALVLLTTSESYHIQEQLKFSSVKPPFEITVRVANISGVMLCCSTMFWPSVTPPKKRAALHVYCYVTWKACLYSLACDHCYRGTGGTVLKSQTMLISSDWTSWISPTHWSTIFLSLLECYS